MRVLYDVSYCLRGGSGIPRDATSLAKVVQSLPEGRLLIYPRQHVRSNKDSLSTNIQLGSTLRDSNPKFSFRNPLRAFLAFTIALFSSSEMKTQGIDPFLRPTVRLGGLTTSSVKVRLANSSIESRWVKSLFGLAPKISSKECDIYVQQQIDPFRSGRNVTSVIRLHDIIPLTHPEFFTSLAVQVFKKGLSALLDKKIVWVMDSKTSANEFRRLLNPRGEIYVIPCAIDDDIISQTSLLPYDKRRKNVLLIGTVEPRKNLELVIDSFLKLKSTFEISEEWSLTIIGYVGWNTESLVTKIRRLEKNGSLVYKEFASRSEVVEELFSSRVLVSASFVEGFGLPPLEGLASGCDILVSDIPQHRETIREMGEYFDPYDSFDLSSKLKKICNSDHAKSIQELKAAHSYVASNYSKDVYHDLWVLLLKQIDQNLPSIMPSY